MKMNLKKLNSLGLLSCIVPCMYAQKDVRPNIIVVLVV